jgi:hypothetical protein
MSYTMRSLLVILILFVIHGAREVTLAQVVRVSVRPQADAPLLLSVVVVEATDPRSPRFRYSLTNRSDKPIRAYTVSINDGGLSGSMRSLRRFSLQPGATQLEEYGDTTSGEPIEAIQLSLDFVEFSDGSVWGSDAAKNAEWLSALRAGMEVERQRLLKALTDGGGSVLSDMLNADWPLPAPPQGHSAQWQQNFQTGAKSFWMLMQKVNREGGSRASESGLQMPYYLRDQ